MKKFWKCLIASIPFLLSANSAHAGPFSLAVTLALSSLVPDSIATIAFINALTTVISVLETVIITIGLNYLEKALGGGGGKKSQAQDNTPSAGQTIQTGGVLPRSFIVGNFETPGKLTYVNTWGQSADSNTPNAYLTMVIALSDIPVTGITGLWAADARVTYGAGTPVDQGYPVPEYNTNGVDHLWVKFYDGTQTEVDSFLTNTFGSDDNYPYDSNRIGTGVAYAIVTMLDDPNLFPSIPTFKFEIDGIKLYDQRLDSTSGGSGSQRWNDKSTWAFTKNPVVIINNILRGIRYNENWVFGLQNLDVSRVPYDTWFTAANECDATILDVDLRSVTQYRCGSEISVNLQPIDVIDELLKACNGRLAEVGGIYKIHVGAADASILSFDDSNIIITEQQSSMPFPSQTNIINGITATYPEPSQAWVQTDAPARYNSDLETLDGNRYVTNIAYNTVPYLEQVERLMASAVLEARKFRQHTFVLPPECWVLEPNDIVSFSSSRNGYNNKLFRVTGVIDNANLDIGVTLLECDPADYDWTPSIDFIPRTDGPLVIASGPASQPLESWAVSPITLVGAGGRQVAAIEVSWATNVTDVNGVLIQVRLASDSSLVLDGQIVFWEGGTVALSQNILSATAYQVRGKYIPRSARDTDWTSWLDVTTDDVRIVAVDLSDDIVDFNNLTTPLFDYNISLGQQIRELIGEVRLLSQTNSELGLGTYTDLQVIRQSLVSTTADITADFESEILAATGPSSAIVADITDLQATIGGTYSPSSTVASALTALTTTVTSNTSSITANSSSITTINAALTGYLGASAVSTAISSLTTTVTSQGSTISSNSSSITTLNNALTGYLGSGAVSTAISSLTSSVSSNTASISANASAITGVSTQVGNFYASGLFRVTTASTPSGADARIALEVAASSGGAAYTAGIFLDALTAGGTRVAILADSFVVTDGTNNHNPFSYSGGILTVDNAVISNLNATHLLTGSVLTANLASNCATEDVNDTVAGVSLNYDDTSVNVASVGVTQVNGYSPVVISVFGVVSSSVTGTASASFALFRDGTLILPFDVNGGSPPLNGEFISSSFGWSAVWIDYGASAGAHTYVIQGTGSNQTGNTGYPSYAPVYGAATISTTCSLTAIYFKR